MVMSVEQMLMTKLYHARTISNKKKLLVLLNSLTMKVTLAILVLIITIFSFVASKPSPQLDPSNYDLDGPPPPGICMW